MIEIGDKISSIHLFKREGNEVKLGYRVDFLEGKEPQATECLDEPIPENLQRRRRARTTAIEAIPGYDDRPYNFEILDDSDGKGFLVYSLAATKDANEVVVGGHSRVTVSEDGRKAESPISYPSVP